jgi:hypothetical protein
LLAGPKAQCRGFAEGVQAEIRRRRRLPNGSGSNAREIAVFKIGDRGTLTGLVID